MLGEVEWDLCKLKMGHGPKDIEKTVRRQRPPLVASELPPNAIGAH